MLEDVGQAPVASGQVLVGDRAQQGPAQARAVGDGLVDVGDGRDATLDERVRLAPESSLEPVCDMSRHF